ncbi:MAG: GNAT family N-acetyltransferase [Kiritimatiellia bacterium]
MEIRKIEPDDIAQVRELIDSIMDSEFSREKGVYNYPDMDDPVDHYGGQRDVFLVAEKDGRIVGTVAIKEDGAESALLRRIFVHGDYRGKGYGERLLASAMEFCFERKYKNVSFRGTDRMQTALKLCLKNGFEQQNVAEVDDFNLVVLTRRLSPGSDEGGA